MKKLLLFATVLLSFASFAQTDLIISEYIDGSGNDKAIEIYNPTAETIDLSKYVLVRFSNGEAYPANLNPKSTSGGYLELIGSLAPGECHVIVNGQTEDNDFSPACSPELQALADQLDNDYPAPTYMNGNDAIGLLKSDDGLTFTSIDIFGEIGLGSDMKNAYGWGPVKDSVLTYNSNGEDVTATISDYVVPANADNGSSFGPFWLAWSKDHSLIRKSDVLEGITANPDPFVINQQWDTLPAVQINDSTWSYANIWTNLGTHAINNGGVSINSESANQVTLFPNPAQGNSFTIISGEFTIMEIAIFNAVGQTIIQANNIEANRHYIDISNTRKGVYFVKVVLSNNKVEINKLIID